MALILSNAVNSLGGGEVGAGGMCGPRQRPTHPSTHPFARHHHLPTPGNEDISRRSVPAWRIFEDIGESAVSLHDG